MFYLHCEFCEEDYEEDLCEVTDVIETAAGREFVFSCPFCGQMSCSKIMMEVEEVREETLLSL